MKRPFRFRSRLLGRKFPTRRARHQRVAHYEERALPTPARLRPDEMCHAQARHRRRDRGNTILSRDRNTGTRLPGSAPFGRRNLRTEALPLAHRPPLLRRRHSPNFSRFPEARVSINTGRTRADRAASMTSGKEARVDRQPFRKRLRLARTFRRYTPSAFCAAT